MSFIPKFLKTPIYFAVRRYICKWQVGLSWFWIRFIMWQPSKHIRRWILNCYSNVQIAKGVPINHGFIWWQGPLTIGKGSTIGFDCQLDCRKGIKIGRNVCFASGVWTWTLHHDYNSSDFRPIGGGIEIGDYAWLCSRCIILPGVKIGTGAIVASGAVVTKDIEPWTVVGGVPAKKIANRERKNYDYNPGAYWIPFA